MDNSSTKDDKIETTDNGDMMEALSKLRETDKTEETEEETKEESKDDKEKTDDSEESEEDLKLDDLKEGDDIPKWKEQKEKGIQKLVERYKRKESELETRTKEFESKSADAETYVKNKETIDNAVAVMQMLADPEQFDTIVDKLRERVKGEKFKPEHESEEKLATHLEKQMAAKIQELESKLEAATKPLLTEQEKRNKENALKQKAKDTYEETALVIASTCNGYQVPQDKYEEAVVAHPSLDPEDAVRKHLFKDIMAHTSELATKGSKKKREITDSASKKESAPPDTSDMMAHLEYLRAQKA